MVVPRAMALGTERDTFILPFQEWQVLLFIAMFSSLTRITYPERCVQIH